MKLVNFETMNARSRAWQADFPWSRSEADDLSMNVGVWVYGVKNMIKKELYIL